MFYHCTKYQFKLERPEVVSGGIIAASGMPRMQLIKRQRNLVKSYPHLAHRMFDPQMYLAKIPQTSKSVLKLATYPWFGVTNQPFHSSQHTVPEWVAANEAQLKGSWTCAVPTQDADIRQAVMSCIDFQLKFGVEGVILPSPLTNVMSGQYELETKFLDAAEELCKQLSVKVPVYATVAFSDQLVRGTDPIKNPLLSTITAQIAARSFIQGAYIVIEQSNSSGHCYNCEEGCLSLLMLADDLSRGAKKRVICNYAGMFGALGMAAGISIWGSGHYRSQRRFSLTDQEQEEGRAYPRLYSHGTFGDIGVENNAAIIYSGPLRNQVLNKTPDSDPLLAAFAAGKSVDSVPAWRYVQGNVSAAAGHYLQLCKDVDDFLSSHDPASRIVVVEKALERAVKLAKALREDKALEAGQHTDLGHQQVWLNAFRKWRGYSKL